MNRKVLFILVVAIAAIITLLWWHVRQTTADEKQISVSNSPSASPAFLGKTNLQSQSSKTAPAITQKQIATSSSKSASLDVLQEFYEKTQADPQYEWKRPINFYGRVVNESNEPVANASVHFTWNDISEKGTSDADTKSDSNGFFSLLDRRGKRLYVDVGKEGYYSSGNSRGSAFEYANPSDGLFTPDAGNPVVFHLRKKGVGVDLITSQYGVKPYFGIPVPLDGTPVKADLLERKTGQGELTVSQIKPDYKHWKQATNWLFRMEIPNGGFVEQNDEFPFTAPEEGYQPVLEFSFQQGQPDWKINLDKNYYVKLGNPPRYGWVHLETSIDMAGARLTYAINPDGARNLEPK
jgi:hypothetical protein